MNTCFCLRLPQPHEHTHQCEVDRVDRMIARRLRRIRQEKDAWDAVRRDQFSTIYRSNSEEET